MYKYVIEIVGIGCEIFSGELDLKDLEKIESLINATKLPLNEVIEDSDLIRSLDIGVDNWYELDDICHVYGSYHRMSRVKVIGEEVEVFNPSNLSTSVDDFYSLDEFNSIYTITQEKGILVKSNLVTKEPFDSNRLTLLVTKVIKNNKTLYVITGFTYNDEYLKLESTLTEQISASTHLRNTTVDDCTLI